MENIQENTSNEFEPTTEIATESADRVYTQQEVEKLIRSEADRTATKAQETTTRKLTAQFEEEKQAAINKAVEDALAYERMTAEEKKAKDLEIAKQAEEQKYNSLQEQYNELLNRIQESERATKLANVATQIASLGDISAETAAGLAQNVLKDTDEETQLALDNLSKYLNEAATAIANGRVAQKTPPAMNKNAVSNKLTKEEFNKLPMQEQQRLYDEQFEMVKEIFGL